MMDLTWTKARELAKGIARYLVSKTDSATIFAYPVPRGGVPAAMLVAEEMKYLGLGRELVLVTRHRDADFYIDDVLDSGKTKDRYLANGPQIPWIVLVDKKQKGIDEWVSFPWDAGDEGKGIEENITRLLQYIGEDPEREGLRDTPKRVAKAYREMFSGYTQNVADLLTVFEDGACNEMVILQNIEFISYCEHHMLPFVGQAHIAYIPDGKVIGVSKLARLLDVYASRLQIQERISQQVTSALETHLKPLGAACVIEAKHLCMVCRGVKKQNSVMKTSSLTGEFLKPEVRAEFFSLIKG